jgi:hypothetical protein
MASPGSPQARLCVLPAASAPRWAISRYCFAGNTAAFAATLTAMWRSRPLRRRRLRYRQAAPNGHGLLGQTGFFDLFSFVKFERPKSKIELGAIL